MTTNKRDGSIEFKFYRPDVSAVGIAGDFNGWQPRITQMTPAGDGWWTARAELKAGEYRFRYVADGIWFTDYASNGVEKTQLGWRDSVLVVPKRKAQATDIQPAMISAAA